MVRHVERCPLPPRITRLRPSLTIAPTTCFPFLAARHFRVDRLPESSLFAFPGVGVRNDIRKGATPIVLGRSRKTASSLLRLGLQRDVLPAVRASGGGLNPHDPRCYRMSQLKNGRWIALSLEQLMKMQGLPRSYKFPVGTSATSKLKLVGNAVCPPIAKSLLLAIREALLT